MTSVSRPTYLASSAGTRLWIARGALCASGLLQLSCALIDPLDAWPPQRVNTSVMAGAPSESEPQAGRGDSNSGGTAPSAGATPHSGAGGMSNASGGVSNAGSAGAGLLKVCEANDECPLQARCSRKACVPLISDECPIVLGKHDDDPSAIFIGAFAPFSAGGTNLQSIRAIYEMAVRDFNEGKERGLRSDVGEPSPLSVIVCNNTRQATPLALHHLIDEVRVPAVLTAIDEDLLLAAFNDYPNTFFVSANNASKALAKVSKGRIWTMLGQISDYADIYRAVIPHAEALLHVELAGQGKDRDIRVGAVLDRNNPFESVLWDAVSPSLKFNGSDEAVFNASDGSARESTYRLRTLDQNSSNLDEVVSDIYNLQPDLVLSFAGGVFTTPGGVMTRLNTKGWSGHRPMYILPPESSEAGADVTAELDRLWIYVTQQDNASRVFGIGPAGPDLDNNNAYNAFAQNLSLASKDASLAFDNYYDAFYFLAYAIYASPRAAFYDDTVHIDSLLRGMRRLTDPQQIAFDIGPNTITQVFDDLEDPESRIQLVGTLGPPDFDGNTGMRRESGSVYCFDFPLRKIQKDVIRYNRETGKLSLRPVPPCLATFLSQ